MTYLPYFSHKLELLSSGLQSQMFKKLSKNQISKTSIVITLCPTNAKETVCSYTSQFMGLQWYLKDNLA